MTGTATASDEAWLPGDPPPQARVAAMLRVDQAGEFGAARIYAGQLAVLGRSAAAPVLRRMAAQEAAHLKTFDTLIAERRVRPTALRPVWSLAGYALGAATALLGERAAMACTVAVEETIDAHYRAQLAELGDAEPALSTTIETFRQEELEHRDIGLAHGAEQTPGFRLLHAAVSAGCRVAIRLSERL